MTRLNILVALLLAGGSATLRAQVIPARPMTPEECLAAVSALESGARDGMGWSRLPACGSEGAAALGRAVKRARLETDSTYLLSLLSAANRIRDAQLLSAGLNVAEDNGASQPARVLALLVLLGQYDNGLGFPMTVSWHDLTMVPRGSACRLASNPEAMYASDDGLSADGLQRTATVTERIARQRANSAVIRDLASCVRQAISDSVPESINPSLIQLRYICDNKFGVRNHSDEWIDASYAVAGTSDRGDLTVAPKDETPFVTDTAGTTQLFYQGRVVASMANKGKSCRSDP